MSRPVIAWDAPAEYDDAALWTWVWDGSAWSTVWTATLRRDCAIEVEWSAVLGDLTPGHDGYFDFYGTGNGFTTHCAFARSW